MALPEAEQKPTALLQVAELTLQRGGSTILKPLTCSFARGQLAVLTGPSGGGKSSLLRLLNRLDEATSGSILLEGEDIRNLPPVALRRRVAMMLQKPVMFAGTVLDNLQSSFRLRGQPLPAGDDRDLQTLMRLCGLEDGWLPRPAEQLSLGQQQRVSLVRALLTKPQLLLLDEPTSALDRPSADQLGGVLRRLCREQGLTILMVSHDLRLTQQIADQVLFMAAGELLETGSGQILQRPQSKELQRFLEDPAWFKGRQEVSA